MCVPHKLWIEGKLTCHKQTDRHMKRVLNRDQREQKAYDKKRILHCPSAEYNFLKMYG